MSGNVWEWVNEENALRGGSFVNVSWFARCAVRYRPYPDYRLNGLGFRIVVSPLFLS